MTVTIPVPALLPYKFYPLLIATILLERFQHVKERSNQRIVRKMKFRGEPQDSEVTHPVDREEFLPTSTPGSKVKSKATEPSSEILTQRSHKSALMSVRLA